DQPPAAVGGGLKEMTTRSRRRAESANEVKQRSREEEQPRREVWTFFSDHDHVFENPKRTSMSHLHLMSQIW
ncbi:hypothetical protein GOODEAATRI_034317, partial [Goodea atripinnis]